MSLMIRTWLLGLAVISLAGACATTEERDWMKVNEQYTVADFRRDHAACTKDRKLDDACMRSRGWVDVSRPAEKAPEPKRGAIVPRAQ